MDRGSNIDQMSVPQDLLDQTLDLLSPASAKRLSCLEGLLSDGEATHKNVIQILVDIDQVPATITNYRDRGRHLDNLSVALLESSLETQTIAFRYLVGSLYVNFEKFWGPTVRTILNLLELSKFKSQLLGDLITHLRLTNDLIYDEAQYADACTPEDRPDHVLHRNFIFQIFHKFARHVQSSNSFIDEFFRFVNKELRTSPFMEKYSRCNLFGQDDQIEEDEEDVSMHVDSDGEVESKAPQKPASSEAGKKHGRKFGRRRGPRPAIARQKSKSKETFITASKVIQSFSSIKNVHRGEEISCLYLELLSCRDSSVQKASFNCLLIDLPDKVRPYTNKVLKLIDEKMVRTEIATFSFESNEFNQVQEDSREVLMPIILRVLFGKMVGKIGKKSAGRDKADLRKTLVMRCIAGCSTKEILFFFSLLFDPIYPFLHTPYQQLEKEVNAKSILESYIPPNKLQAMLVSLTACIDSIAHLNEDLLPYILKLICIIIAHVTIPLDDAATFQKLSHKYQESFKILRRGCLNIVTGFFRTFEYHRFDDDEINFVFSKLIWTSAQGFTDRNFAFPTPLLKFIDCLASNRVYHKLLVKRNAGCRDEYLLNHLIELYTDHKTERRILKMVATMLANIIKPDRDLEGFDDAKKEEHLKVPMIEDKDVMIPEYDTDLYNIPADIEFSQQIMIKFIPSIFNRLKKNCQIFVESKTPESRIENDELILLSSLSLYLKDPEQSVLASKLLLMTLNNHKKADLIEQTLKTVQSLMQQVSGCPDEALISHVADIIGYQRDPIQRRELCNLLEIISRSNIQLATISKSIKLMNQMHEDLVECPDLVKWVEGFQLAFKFLDDLTESDVNDEKVMRDSVILLVHQIAFIISNVDRYEFSIRDNCQIFFEKLASKLKLLDEALNKKMKDELISEILLEKFVKKGLRSTNETVKNTYIGVLRSLALHCYAQNRTLKEFHLFCSDNQDVDFWLSIKHIQLHHRSRALAKLISDKRLEEVSPKTLSSYFLPIASGFLFSKAFKTVSSLTENSIKLIGIICKHLNWSTYESTLSYYLALLTKANATYQKTNIKLITEILKNFNFDITACKEAMQFEAENAKLEKRMERHGSGANSLEVDKNLVKKKLNPSTSKMVYFAVIKKLIPRLNSCLHEMTRVEFEHDKNMSDYLPEKDEVRRIPIAYAIVQLLNLLPCRYIRFRDHLPQLFLKLASFLKSKNEQVRKVARSVIVKIMNFVGPAYIPELMRALKQNLSRGFQVHVLSYTLHSVLEKITLSYGDLENSLEDIVECCLKEIFGQASEDKEVAAILAKTFEAKKTKSYDTLMIVASCIHADKLDFLMNSIKNILKTSTEAKKINKLSQCIHRIFTGLAKNKQFPLNKMFSFIESTIDESIPSLKVRQKVDQVEGYSQSTALREDRYLIKKDLPRDRIKSRINDRGNFHMLVENSLRLLLQVFEENRNQIKTKGSLAKQLDGFIKLLSTCLKSSSPRCVMRSLKCIYFITRTKADLPTFRLKSQSIVKKIFILLNLYNGIGMVQGDNWEMISMCFKTLTILLLKCEHVQLNQEQTRALFVYVEQDLRDVSRQATAFGTLNSLLKRKCDSPELEDIMLKVAELLVTSEDSSVRNQSIRAWEIYLLEHTHKSDKVKAHLTYFLRQLDYEFIDGRRAVLKLLEVVITKFPEALLSGYYQLIFHLLSQRLANDESHEIRQSVGRLIGTLLQRLPDKRKGTFDKIVIPWASSNSDQLKLLATKLMSVFVESSKGLFTNETNRVKTMLENICQSLNQKNTVAVKDLLTSERENGSESADSGKENLDSNMIAESDTVSISDRLTYHSLRLFKRLLTYEIVGPIDKRYIEKLSRIWVDIASKQLSHKHMPVVLTCCQLYILFLRQVNLMEQLKSPPEANDNESFLARNAKRIVRMLCDNFIDLLDRAGEDKNLFNYITEGLILLGQIVANSHATLDFEKKYHDSFENGDVISHMLSIGEIPQDGFVQDHLPHRMNEAKRRLNLMWLSVKVVMQARKEAALFRTSKSYRRNFVLKWTAAMTQELGQRRLSPYVFLFMMTPTRELTDKGKPSADSEHDVTTLSGDLLKFIKSLLGIEVFSKVYSRMQLHFTRRRVDRKQKEAIAKVKDQARGVKRKLKKNKDKGSQKKRKIMDIRRAKGHLQKRRRV